MIERRDHRPPVTYTTFEARDLGSDTAEIFKDAVCDAYERHKPEAIIVGASCTAELIQDDPGGLARAIGLPIPVVPLELPSYQRKEHWGAAETFYQLVRHLAKPTEVANASAPAASAPQTMPRCNILGPTALGFRHRDDTREIIRLLQSAGVEINVVAPLGATPGDIARLGDADFNVVLYPEIAETSARWLEKQFGQPYTRTVPFGVGATRDFIAEVAELVGANRDSFGKACGNLPWWSRSIDSNYLTGKRVFVFGEATAALSAARVAADELAFEVVGLGAYNREYARLVREAAGRYGVEPLITDDYLAVEKAIEAASPELILGTQMERHIAKRLGIPAAVISSPAHVQDYPARYSPQMGFEGANVLFDTWVHPLVMGLEEHLLTMFRDDFEFHDGAGASHLGGHGATAQPAEHAVAATVEGNDVNIDVPGTPISTQAQPDDAGAKNGLAFTTDADAPDGQPLWHPDAERELKKIPFFVRGKARRNTESFAQEQEH